ncbi:MAG: hypothetical protein QOF61_2593, partial [Acidobacteriota bacterium]|nr:hypothetical protein [Acidobacteriota bacterium]
MSYRCPLCLKELTAADQLVRFCPTHNKQRLDAPFNCEPSTLTRRVFCPRLGCTN